MQHRTSYSTHSSNLNFLKSYIKSVDATLAHLSHLVGAHINELDKSLSKRSGKHSVKVHMAKLQTPASTSEKSIFSAITRSISYSASNPSASSNSAFSRMSRRQVLAEIAASITKSISRDL